MEFPLTELMDQGACDARLVEALHPDCPGCPRCDSVHSGDHRRRRMSVLVSHGRE
jgi:hypothetical protein